MKIEVSKNALAGALAALGKLVSRMSPVEEYKSVLIVLENGTLSFHTCGPEETMEFTLNCEADYRARSSKISPADLRVQAEIRPYAGCVLLAAKLVSSSDTVPARLGRSRSISDTRSGTS